LSSWNGDFQNFFSTIGFESSELYLFQVKAISTSATACLQPGEKLSKINGVLINQWETIVEAVKNYDNSGNPISLEVSRRGEQVAVSVVPKMTELMKASGAEDNRFTIGIVPAVFTAIADPVFVQYKNPILALQKGVEQSWVWSKMVAMSFIRMIQNEVSAKNIGGVISIGKYAGQSYQVGLTSFLKLMAIISINLFLINLLPVPILDGGHLLFFTIEAIRGAPLSMRKMEIAQQVGLIILMSLMVFALFNDISNLINPPW
jgi:regulator of sigma E protease